MACQRHGTRRLSVKAICWCSHVLEVVEWRSDPQCSDVKTGTRLVLTDRPHRLKTAPVHMRWTLSRRFAMVSCHWMLDTFHSAYQMYIKIFCTVGKGKEMKSIYIALLYAFSLKALRHGSHSFTCKLHHACLSFASVHQMAPSLNVVANI